jgi:hypothetical protein
MQQPTSPNPPIAPVTRKKAGPAPRSYRPRTALRPRHLEAHAVAWLRSLRNTELVGSRRSPASPRRS